MSVDVKVIYQNTVRRLKLPFNHNPTFQSLLELAVARNNLNGGAQAWTLLYIDAEGERVTISSDVEVDELWPRQPSHSKVSLEDYIDSLPPLRFHLEPKTQTSSFSVPDATGDEIAPALDFEAPPSPIMVPPVLPAERQLPSQQGQDLPFNREEQPAASGLSGNLFEGENQDAQDPPDFDLPEVDELPIDQSSPIITATRSIVDVLQSHLERLPLDESIRGASVGILNSVASIGISVDQLARTGQDVFRAVLSERAERLARETETRPEASSDGTSTGDSKDAGSTAGLSES